MVARSRTAGRGPAVSGPESHFRMSKNNRIYHHKPSEFGQKLKNSGENVMFSHKKDLK